MFRNTDQLAELMRDILTDASTLPPVLCKKSARHCDTDHIFRHVGNHDGRLLPGENLSPNHITWSTLGTPSKDWEVYCVAEWGRLGFQMVA
ncbi:cbf0eefa-848f-4a0c-a6f3-afeb9a8523d1-CDS [Sclerotinia trifoliorum]|uniref:Cbf0eefa-848f-4a0c-a6f3-afeb9a8523d1-CDS n=1 Tax=Sclerotinia trifoliorum TaxID=28548 RepID=A0A8H2W3Q4_9HELO|nr:cbf0eefa-848f-4a0c-a6f3-afeb9a8523d1-CDS [Sclerotinia trifoliorum]